MPKPRDFRSGKFRLVSTSNNVPTHEDLDAVIVRGMPGSSMPPWGHLSRDERKLLIDEIMRLYREGMRDQYIASLRDQEGLSDHEISEDPDLQEEISLFVARRTTPGETRTIPEFGEPDADTIARGREVYFKQSCHSCHGNDGRGDGSQEQFDDEGFPSRPRDYTRGIFKGGHDVASLYRRTAYGMPGTPMPGSTQLLPGQIVDLVHFLRSLSDEQTRQAAILRREQIRVVRVDRFTRDADHPIWETIAQVTLRMMPLWWRDDFDPQQDTLRVQALHDGHSLALRLSWPDAVANHHALASESFKDAVAAELYSNRIAARSQPSAEPGGELPRYLTEPFLGMGDAQNPIDLWYWDADRQSAGDVVADAYPHTVVDIYPFSEKTVATAELDRRGAEPAQQPPFSQPALASGNPIVPAAGTKAASSLSATGPGSVTFRLPQNQLVEAQGQWSDGRWTVVMTRPLKLESQQTGISLEPGDQVSIALAVWDGFHRDRDGKKLVTIWQDLTLEE